MALDLLHSFEILSQLGIQGVGNELGVPTVPDVSLSVQEPLGNVVVYTQSQFESWKSKLTGGLGNNIIDLFDLSFGQLSGSRRIKS